MTAPDITKVPSGLKAMGKLVWSIAWASPTVTPDDYLAVLKLAKLEDEREKYASRFAPQPAPRRKRGEEPQPAPLPQEVNVAINGGTNYLLHRERELMLKLDSQIESLYDKLGLTPLGRFKMGVLPQVEVNDPIANQAADWDARGL